PALLRDTGLSPPEMSAVDADNGRAVVEDFGDDLFARVIERGEPEEPLYHAAVEALARLHAAGAPDRLTGPAGDWPLLTYDAVALEGGVALFLEWLPRLDPRLDFGDAARAEWDEAWAPVARAAEEAASVIAHRDYHAENLIWLPQRSGTARVGMIDFQDAVRAHPAWDLHSLLQDARRDVSLELEPRALDRYFALRPEVDREAFLRDYVDLAVLNEARILGVFARLVVRDGKARYRAFMPRMWDHLFRNLPKADPRVAAWFATHVPAEV